MSDDKKEIAEKAKTAVAEMDVSMFEADAGAGMQMDQEDLALPFLKVLSAMDPGLQSGEIDAKAGDIYNTVTGAVYPGKEGVKVIPCAYQRRFIEWSPRGQGSGAPINMYSPSDDRPETERNPDDNKDYVKGGDGSYIEETHQHYVVIVESDGTYNTALIPMKSTQLKKSRRWNSMVASQMMHNKDGVAFQPPRFSFVYNLKILQEKNDKGSWHGWDITRESEVGDAGIYRAAKAFSESISAGDVVVKHVQDGADDEDDAPF